MITTNLHLRDEDVMFGTSELTSSVSVSVTLDGTNGIILFFPKDENGKQMMLDLHRVLTKAVAMVQRDP